MKTFGLSALVLFAIALLFASVLFGVVQPAYSESANGVALLSMQVTPVSPQQDDSVVGSTDGIALMGAIITGICLLPLLLRKKK